MEKSPRGRMDNREIRRKRKRRKIQMSKQIIVFFKMSPLSRKLLIFYHIFIFCTPMEAKKNSEKADLMLE